MNKYLISGIFSAVVFVIYLIKQNTKLTMQNHLSYLKDTAKKELEKRVNKAKIDAKKNKKGEKYRRKDEN